MDQRSGPPFRADHVGSFLRPLDLAAARERAHTGDLPAEDARAIEDACVRDVVAMQEELGFSAVTDGEFRRDYWHLDFMWGMDGVARWDAQRLPNFSNDQQPPTARVEAKVSNPGGVFTDMYRFVHGITSRVGKQTIPGPAMIHLRAGREAVDTDAYPEMDDFWSDWVAAYRAEVAALYEAGCRYLQIDDVSLAYLCDDKMRAAFRERGDDPDHLAGFYTRLINEVVSERPADMAVTVHTCRGNFQSSWMAEGGYEPVAETVFGSLAVDGIFMEFDSERAGGFEPLRFLSEGQVAVLGLITTKTPELEAKDDVKRRIEQASQFVPLENLCLSPQCGFASTHHGNAVTVDDQKRKLSLVVETASEVWG